LSYKVIYEIITPAISVNNTTSEYKTKNTKLKIITIGRLNWIKGISIAITAMGKLKNNNIPFEYHIIGGGTQEEFEYNKFMAHKLELINEIKFHGELSHEESLSLLSTADLYIQPSINEGFCNAVLEAQAMGILPIVSDAGGLPENVINNETGFVIEKLKPELLAQKIEDVIHLSKDIKLNMQKKAIDRIRNNFSLEKQQKEFVNFYTTK
jgi:colanic acid/amylovoran biosynthesis glycosyltransferase